MPPRRVRVCEGGENANKHGGDAMTWLDLTRNWAKSYALLRETFPNLEQSAMPFVKQDQSRFENYLAATHNMTLEEAQAAFDDFLAGAVPTDKENAHAAAS